VFGTAEGRIVFPSASSAGGTCRRKGSSLRANDPGGHRRARATHERAAETHKRAAELHEKSANFHEDHAVEMREKGHIEWVERAERLADRERELAEQQRASAEKHRRAAEAEPVPAD
jgi:hypothetical protein